MLPILEHFEKYLTFTVEEKQLFEGKIMQRKIKRRELILQAGFICQHQYRNYWLFQGLESH